MSSQLNPVDRHEEVVEREQPGYREREAVVVDEVAEQRATLARLNQLVWLLAGLLEALLALRFLLRLIAANATAAFAQWVYTLSDLFLFPFSGLIANPNVGGATFEITTLIAMLVYALLAWAVTAFLRVLFTRSYTSSRVTHRHIDTDERE